VVGDKINHTENDSKSHDHGNTPGVLPPFARKSDFCAAYRAAVRFQHKRIVFAVDMTASCACVGNHIPVKPRSHVLGCAATQDSPGPRLRKPDLAPPMSNAWQIVLFHGQDKGIHPMEQ
jgi:hypothetical protein